MPEEQGQTNDGQEIPPKKKRATTRRGTKKPTPAMPAIPESFDTPAWWHASDLSPEELANKRLAYALQSNDPLLRSEAEIVQRARQQAQETDTEPQYPRARTANDPFSVESIEYERSLQERDKALRGSEARAEDSGPFSLQDPRTLKEFQEQARMGKVKRISLPLQEGIHGVTSIPGTPINTPRVEEPEHGSLAGIIPEGLGSASTIVRARPTRKLPESRSTTEIPVVLGGGTPTFRGDYPRPPETLPNLTKRRNPVPFAIPRPKAPFAEAVQEPRHHTPIEEPSAPLYTRLSDLPTLNLPRLPSFHNTKPVRTIASAQLGRAQYGAVPDMAKTRPIKTAKLPRIAPGVSQATTAQLPTPPVQPPLPTVAGQGSGNNSEGGVFAGLSNSLNTNTPQTIQTQQARFQPSIVTGIPSSILLFAGLALVAVNAVNQVFGAAGATGVSIASFVLGIQPIAQSGGILNKLPANMFGTILAETALVLFLTLVVAKISSFFNYTVTGIIALFWLAWLVENGAKLAGIWKGFVGGVLSFGSVKLGTSPLEPSNPNHGGSEPKGSTP